MDVDQLSLAPAAYKGAKLLAAMFPEIVFTSGRRSIEKQARVMAVNSMKNRRFIEQTYLDGDSLQQVVNKLPIDCSQATMEANLYNALLSLDAIGLMRVSRHLTGDAFDIQPIVDCSGIPSTKGQMVIDYIRRNMAEAKMLLREGGLVIWHVQFPPSIQV